MHTRENLLNASFAYCHGIAPLSRRRRIAAIDRLLYERARRRGREIGVGFHFGRFGSESGVLDGVAKPGGVVAGFAVELPGIVVHPFGDLDEQDQILRFEIERTVFPFEIEAALGPEIALGIFADIEAWGVLKDCMASFLQAAILSVLSF